MRIAGMTKGKQVEVQQVRTVTLVTRWIHEMFENRQVDPLVGIVAEEPLGKPVPPD